MEIDRDKIDDAILALLYLTLDRDGRAWKENRLALSYSGMSVRRGRQ